MSKASRLKGRRNRMLAIHQLPATSGEILWLASLQPTEEGGSMNALDILAEIFKSPLGMNVAVGLFVLAAFFVAWSFHRRIREIQNQNAELIALLQKIEINTQARHAP